MLDHPNKAIPLGLRNSGKTNAERKGVWAIACSSPTPSIPPVLIRIPGASSHIPILGFQVHKAQPLPYPVIVEIEEAEEDSPQVSQMRDAGARPPQRGPEFYGAKQEHEMFGLHGDHKPDIDVSFRKKPGVGQQQSVYRPRGSHNGDTQPRGKYHRANSRADTRYKEVLGEPARSHVPFDFTAEYPEGEEVKQDVPQPSVQEDVGHQLPYEELTPE